VKLVAGAVQRGRAGIRNASQPIASFIFLGPTGVGKTELARRTAEVVFGSQGSMIRVDMSEYMEKHSVSRMIGAPPGYAGHDEAASSRRPSAATRTRSCSSTRSRRPTPTCSTFSCRSSRTAGSRTAGPDRGLHETIIMMTSNIGGSLSKETVANTIRGFLGLPKKEEEPAKDLFLQKLESLPTGPRNPRASASSATCAR